MRKHQPQIGHRERMGSGPLKQRSLHHNGAHALGRLVLRDRDRRVHLLLHARHAALSVLKFASKLPRPSKTRWQARQLGCICTAALLHTHGSRLTHWRTSQRCKHVYKKVQSGIATEMRSSWHIQPQKPSANATGANLGILVVVPPALYPDA